MDAGRRRRARRMRVLRRLGRAVGGAEPRVLGCLHSGGEAASRGGAAAASAWHSRGHRGFKLLGLEWGIEGGGVALPSPPRRNGAAFSAATGNKRLRLPFKVCPSFSSPGRTPMRTSPTPSRASTRPALRVPA